MANTDRARKLMVRSALVTSTTIATLVGAQNFAMLDANQFDTTAIDTIANVAPEMTIVHTAPTITVLRQSSGAIAQQPTVVPQQSTQQITAPNPVIVQRPVVRRSHSSR